MRRGLSGNVRQYIRDGQKIKRRETPVVPSMRPGLLPPCIETSLELTPRPPTMRWTAPRKNVSRVSCLIGLGLSRILSQPDSESAAQTDADE